jgi:hypothetical protein
MRRTISSAQTFFMKWIFPGLWVGGVGLITYGGWFGILHRRDGRNPEWMKWWFLIVWLFGTGSLLLRKEKQIVKSQDQWPFGDPKNVAVITLKSITMGGSPILHVTHDADDRMWQFLDGSTVSEANASVVSLEEITQIDPSLMELADLPLGWYADRSAPSEPWRRGKN